MVVPTICVLIERAAGYIEPQNGRNVHAMYSTIMSRVVTEMWRKSWTIKQIEMFTSEVDDIRRKDRGIIFFCVHINIMYHKVSPVQSFGGEYQEDSGYISFSSIRSRII